MDSGTGGTREGRAVRGRRIQITSDRSSIWRAGRRLARPTCPAAKRSSCNLEVRIRSRRQNTHALAEDERKLSADPSVCLGHLIKHKPKVPNGPRRGDGNCRRGAFGVLARCHLHDWPESADPNRPRSRRATGHPRPDVLESSAAPSSPVRPGPPRRHRVPSFGLATGPTAARPPIPIEGISDRACYPRNPFRHDRRVVLRGVGRHSHKRHGA